MKGAPANYTPFYFVCEQGDKNPYVKLGSWKTPRQRLTFAQAVRWMELGWNVGIAATDFDNLVIVDLDDLEKTPIHSIKPTLLIKSRKRAGIHAIYFGEGIPNIPTDYGEVRSSWQYVICSGSYINPPKKREDLDRLLSAVPIEDQDNFGYYTIYAPQPPEKIAFEELPEIFITTSQTTKENEKKAKKTRTFNPKFAEKGSALFEISAQDIVWKEGGNTNPSERWGSVFHGSETGKNTSLSNDGLIQCWRCNVSHNGLQALVALSGYLSCREAGTSHNGGNAGSSMIIGDDGAIFHAWRYAKLNSYIPQNDPIPIRAMKFIAEKHGLISKEIEKNGLPGLVYNEVLRIVREEY